MSENELYTIVADVMAAAEALRVKVEKIYGKIESTEFAGPHADLLEGLERLRAIATAALEADEAKI